MEVNQIVFFANACNIVNYVCAPYTYLFSPGLYLLEVWGASGGNATITHTDQVSQYPTYGGKGGYSKGVIQIHHPTNAFIYVGEKGFIVTETGKNSRGTFGGGGNLTLTTSYAGHGCIGGGATDIRLNKDNLYSRVIVAGGGGGAAGGMTNSYGTHGGDGGGKEGYKGFDDTQPQNYYTFGGTQESGGKTNGCYYCPIGYNGEFGLGGGTTNYNTNYGGSGGGGWFGGAGGAHRISGAGGSGYAFNESSYKPPNFLLNQSYYLTNSSVLDGKTQFPIPSENFYNNLKETGHVGNGAVRITFLSETHNSPKPKILHSCICLKSIYNIALVFTFICFST
jgi:hypothetical protein